MTNIQSSNEVNEKKRLENIKLKKVFINTFSTEDGKKVLASLEKEFLGAPVAVVGTTPDYAFFREGQNDLIRQIKTMLIIEE